MLPLSAVRRQTLRMPKAFESSASFLGKPGLGWSLGQSSYSAHFIAVSRGVRVRANDSIISVGGQSPVRDLVGGGVVLEPDPRRVVLGDEALRLPLVDVAVVEQLVDDLAVLDEHVLRRNLSVVVVRNDRHAVLALVFSIDIGEAL